MSENNCNACQHNENPCTCPDINCKNHGKCCDCVVTHRKSGTPPMCMREKKDE